MSVQPLTWDDFEEAQQQGPEPTVLSGWRLWSARGLWALVMLVTVGLFAASIKPYFDFVLFFPKFWFSSPDYAPALEQLSLTAGFYYGYLIALQGLRVLVCLVIAALIFKNKSDDWLALFVSLTLVAYAASQGDQIGALLMNAPELRYAGAALAGAGRNSLAVVALFLPRRRLQPELDNTAGVDMGALASLQSGLRGLAAEPRPLANTGPQSGDVGVVQHRTFCANMELRQRVFTR